MTKYEDPKKYLRNKIMTDISALVDDIDLIAIKAIRDNDDLDSIKGLIAMEMKLISVVNAVREMDELNTFASKFNTMKTMYEVRDGVRIEALKPYMSVLIGEQVFGMKARASINNTILTMMELFDCI